MATKREWRVTASALLGLEPDNPLLGFIEETISGSDDEPDYVFVGVKGRARVTAKQLCEFRYCDAAITAATGEVVDKITPANWRKVRRALMAAKTKRPLGAEASVGGKARSWLRAALVTYPPFEADIADMASASDEAKAQAKREFDLAMGYGHPVRWGGRVWFSAESLFDDGEKTRSHVDRRGVMREWKAMGCGARRTLHYTTFNGTRTTRAMYAVSAAFLAEVFPKKKKPTEDPA